MHNQQKTRFVIAGLTTLFLLAAPIRVAYSTSLVAPPPTRVQGAQAPAKDGGWATPKCDDGVCKEMDAYRNSRFGYCDAQVLGKLWQISTWNAKVRIGQKLLLKNQSIVAGELRTAFTRGTCDQAFNFNDAAQVAELWSTGPNVMAEPGIS